MSRIRDDTDHEVDLESAIQDERTHYPNQSDMNASIRDLRLTQSNGELLTSELEQWNPLHANVKVTDQSRRHL